MYGISNVSEEQMHKEFCKVFNIKEQKISDSKFVKILNICWQNRMDMHFMGSAYGDGEDVSFATEQNYKNFVLFNLYDYYYYCCGTEFNKAFSDIRSLFKKARNNE